MLSNTQVRDEHIFAVCGTGHYDSKTQKEEQLQDFRILIFRSRRLTAVSWSHEKKVCFPELTFLELVKIEILF